MAIVVFLVTWPLGVNAADEVTCFDEPTNLAIDQCLRRQLATADKALTEGINRTNMRLTHDERTAFMKAHVAWKKYRDLHCSMAGLMFRGGRMQPLTEGACRVRLTKERLLDIEAIDIPASADRPK